MPAFSGLYDGVFGDGYAALDAQTRPPMLRGLVRVLMQKRGMHGTVNALGRAAPDTIAQVDAQRGTIAVNGTFNYATRTTDKDVDILNIDPAYSGETVARVPNATEADLANSFDTTLNVLEGASVSNTFGFLGAQAGSTGMATVTGTDSRWANSGYLYVGLSGDGTLNVAAWNPGSKPVTVTLCGTAKAQSFAVPAGALLVQRLPR